MTIPIKFHNETFRELSAKDRATTSIAVKMALRGHQQSWTSFHSVQKPYCDEPIFMFRALRGGPQTRSLEVSMYVPCRKCSKCLLFRQLRWRQRALTEINRSKRTWFVTLTFAPTHLAGIIYEANNLNSGNLAANVERAAYAHVQKYFKRLRKQKKLKFRYLAIYERGEKTGRSHYHLLIHEVGERPVSKRTLESKWRSNVHCRLVHKAADGAASYVTKYATKSLGVQPRASLKYGAAATPPK